MKLDYRNIKKLRKDRKYTRVQLSKLSNIPLTTLHDLEEGKTKNPGVLTLISVADAFGIEFEELMNILKE